MALDVASTGDKPSVAIMRSTFSMTTIASSTIIPIASTIPNMVSTLIEKPASSMTENVPSNAIGATIAGIKVYRTLCKKINMTIKTNAIASSNVMITFSIEIFTKGAVS